ncbi:MAG TPA: adenylate/guanylate cyclase domain-containing protein [Anaerolineales bacterium]|nr:adenylate/guanylate cyclase domain-containing protein [Anaerolineales bacterium]
MDKRFFSDNLWYHFLTGEFKVPPPMFIRVLSGTVGKVYKILPSNPHCSECGIPMAGAGGNSLRFMGSAPSSFSSRLCSGCERAIRKQEGGAEVELTMVFADVRDSTPLAEEKGVTGFKDIINRFFKESSKVLIEHNAMVNRLVGDQVIGLFVPRFAGKNHAQTALEATMDLLRVTGHGQGKDPWISVGAGIHTGPAYVGAVGSANGVNEVAVLGSSANLCARLSSKAAAGEILISTDSVKFGDLDVDGLETRSLELKGVSQPVSVSVVKV